MKMESLKDLYVAELKDLYSAESQIVKALPKMARAATSKDLKKGFQDHLKQTRGHLLRLKEVFKDLDAKPAGKHCKGMEGLLKEGAEVIKEKADPATKDAALIAAAQRVEHYEMAGYGCVRTYARLLGFDNAANLLQETLDEEGDTDKHLSEMAEEINVEAGDTTDETQSAAKRNGRGRNGRSRKTVGSRILQAVGI